MEVIYENKSLTIKDLDQEAVELILDSLIRFVNITLKEKASDAAITHQEKAKLREDRKVANKMYKAIEYEFSKFSGQ